MQINTFDEMLNYFRTTMFEICHDRNSKWWPKIHDIAPKDYPDPWYNFNEYFWFEVNLIEIEHRFKQLEFSIVDIFNDTDYGDFDDNYKQMNCLINSFGHSDYNNSDNIKLLYKLFINLPYCIIYVKNDYICVKWPDSHNMYYFDRNGDKVKLRLFTRYDRVYVHSSEIDAKSLFNKYEISEISEKIIFNYRDVYPEVLIDELRKPGLF